MGTVVAFDLYLEDGEQRAAVLGLASARRELHRADAIFSTYRPESPINAIRRGELAPEDAPAVVAEVLERCSEVRELSEGWFDPWAAPGGVDPTGLVKGWATERARDALAEAGVRIASVNAGGDIAMLGVPPGQPHWRIGVRSPLRPDELVAVVEVSRAIATSGTYERGAHLYSPRSASNGVPVPSATVLAADLTTADGLATALAVAGPPFLERLAELGFAAFVVTDRGEISATPDFPFAPLTAG